MEERIKEMEKKEAAAESATPATAAPVAAAPVAATDVATTDGAAPVAPAKRKPNRVMHLLGEMWPAYLIEVFVIILGITITLALEEWRDEGKEAELEKVYLANLAADIEEDLRSLHYAATNTDSLMERGEEIRQFVRDPEGHSLTSERLNKNVRNLLDRPNFLSHDATFSDLKSSGNLHLLKDITLKGLLFSYYSKADNIHRIQDAEQAATINLVAVYFLKWFSMDPSQEAPILQNPGGIKALAGNVEFRNQVGARVAMRRELREQYADATALAEKLQKLLRKAD